MRHRRLRSQNLALHGETAARDLNLLEDFAFQNQNTTTTKAAGPKEIMIFFFLLM